MKNNKNLNLPIITNFNTNNAKNINNRGHSLKTNSSENRIKSNNMKRIKSIPKINNLNDKSFKNEETKSFIEDMKNVLLIY